MTPSEESEERLRQLYLIFANELGRVMDFMGLDFKKPTKTEIMRAYIEVYDRMKKAELKQPQPQRY